MLITDPGAPGGIVGSVEGALSPPFPPLGRVAVQLRNKDARSDVRAAQARALRGVTRRAGAWLLVNGDLDLARARGADGVHLPESGPTVAQARAALGARTLVGVSRHDRAGLVAAARDGADFALLSPIFPVPGKSEPLGLDGLAAALGAQAPLPVVALGGIGPENAVAVCRAGAKGVAVRRSVFRSQDPAGTVRALLSVLNAADPGGETSAAGRPGPPSAR